MKTVIKIRNWNTPLYLPHSIRNRFRSQTQKVVSYMRYSAVVETLKTSDLSQFSYSERIKRGLFYSTASELLNLNPPEGQQNCCLDSLKLSNSKMLLNHVIKHYHVLENRLATSLPNNGYTYPNEFL